MNRYLPELPRIFRAMLVLSVLFPMGCGRQNPTDPMSQFLAGTSEHREQKPAPPEPERKSEDEAAVAPMEKLKLSVLRVKDPRLPDLDEPSFQLFLRTLTGWAERASRRELEIDLKEPVAIQKYFQDHEEVLRAPLGGKGPAVLRFDVRGPDAVAGMKGCLAESSSTDLRKYFGDAPADLDSADAWAEYLVNDFGRKWAQFHQAHPPHPPLIAADQEQYSRPDCWRALADDPDQRVDLIVTNAFIAGAEHRMGLDRIQRGGMMTGLWSVGQKKNGLGLTMVISVQPVLCRSPFVIDVPDRARPAVAAIYTWRYLNALWSREPLLADPLSAAVGLVSGSQEQR